MLRPPLGLAVPCKLARVRDGDTVEVTLRTGQTVAVRLIDCFMPEKKSSVRAQREQAEDAACYLSLIAGSDDLTVWFPLPRDYDQNDRIDLIDVLKGFTFDRVPGRVFLEDGRDVSEVMTARYGRSGSGTGPKN